MTRRQESVSTDAIATRFAPSPTGRLHLGHAWSACLAHDFARAIGGRFRLRIEDIDPGRAREAFIDGIIEDLQWLGIDWDGPVVRQSERLSFYAAALDRLRAANLVYPCFCTRAEIAAEIAASATAPHGPDGPLYPGTCRHLTIAERKDRLTACAPHAWRLDMARATAAAGPLTWTDIDHGRIPATPDIHGDVVLARKDAPTSYHLAVTIDDAAQDISHVIRGEDLRTATHVHRLLQALLDLPCPAYRHHPLLAGPDGKRLAKRDGAKSLAELRAEGVDAKMLRSRLRAMAQSSGENSLP